MTCVRPQCTRAAECAGFCLPCYGKRVSAGLTAKVPATAVRDHVLTLRRHGWTFVDIHAASGVSHKTLCRLIKQRGPTVRQATARRLLALPLTGRDHALVPVIGVRRRIRALVFIGWPLSTVAEKCGVSPRTLYDVNLGRSGTCSAWLYRRVCEVYHALWTVPGPSKRARTWARRKGWHGPMTWDDDTIDDPSYRPCGDRNRRRQSTVNRRR